jgi:murein DD-endopeptidase MepM/ murein hydrolase activator NlpD
MDSNNFHPVIKLPEEYEIYDFSKTYDPNRKLKLPYGVGKFLEHRPTMYTQPQFAATSRNIHMGIDIGAPVNTPIFAFSDGEVFSFTYNSAPSDYGYTLITKTFALGETLYCLHGHLSKASIEGKKVGDPIRKGETIAWVGNSEENGGWNPHLHFQISRVMPLVCDMPGAVSESDLENSLKIYLDPRKILGKIY